MQFYAQIMNDVPYPSMTIAVIEDELPGGHSPAYATVLNSPPPTSQFLWRNDPAAFLNFPEFFLAHELAHQWWGQAVGWKNYHEQWISEGFAQYFAALYAQRSRGDGVFLDMLRQFRRWTIAESDEGPVYLGYRLGHVKGDTRVFRALVYNKGAGVLHMLRRLVGDQAFFNGLRRFYSEQRFRKAGTDDFARAMEAESGISLDRFFERWIYGSTLPRLRYTSTISEREVLVRFEQTTEEIFDLPVTVTLTFSDGRTRDVVVPVMSQRVEQRIPVDSTVRQVQINRDSAALAQFEGT
jgi:aminopeptidase N